MAKSANPGLVLLACATIAGCSTLQVHTNYGDLGSINTRLVGRAKVVLADEDQDLHIQARPQSVTGWLREADVPVGQIVQTVGDEVCDRYFTGGTSDGDSAPTYIVKVKPVGFHYKFDQVRNAGFAISPEVSIKLDIQITRRDGTVLVPEQVYERRDHDSTGVFTSTTHPFRRINMSLHEAIKDVYLDALNQIPRPSA